MTQNYTSYYFICPCLRCFILLLNTCDQYNSYIIRTINLIWTCYTHSLSLHYKVILSPFASNFSRFVRLTGRMGGEVTAQSWLGMGTGIEWEFFQADDRQYSCTATIFRNNRTRYPINDIFDYTLSGSYCCWKSF